MPPKNPITPASTKKQLLDVRVGGTKRLQDPDFAAPFEDGHDQGVDDAKRGDGECQAAENPKKQIEDGEERAEGLAGIKERERVKAHRFDANFQAARHGKRISRGPKGWHRWASSRYCRARCREDH